MTLSKIMVVILFVFLSLEPFVHGTSVEHVPEEDRPTTTLVVNGSFHVTGSFGSSGAVTQDLHPPPKPSVQELARSLCNASTSALTSERRQFAFTAADSTPALAFPG